MRFWKGVSCAVRTTSARSSAAPDESRGNSTSQSGSLSASDPSSRSSELPVVSSLSAELLSSDETDSDTMEAAASAAAHTALRVTRAIAAFAAATRLAEASRFRRLYSALERGMRVPLLPLGDRLRRARSRASAALESIAAVMAAWAWLQWQLSGLLLLLWQCIASSLRRSDHSLAASKQDDSNA